MSNSKMKAIILRAHGGPEKLEYENYPVPEIGEGEALIEVKACSLNHLDVWVREGKYYDIFLPRIPGSDISGVVRETKGGNFAVGDEVVVYPILYCGNCTFCSSGEENLCMKSGNIGAAADGGYAEFVKIPQQNLFKKPSNLSFGEAASIPVAGITAWHMLKTKANLQADETVLIWGAGSGLGVNAIQMAKLLGAKVIAAASGSEKLEKARKLCGADETIDRKTGNVEARVLALTNGNGIDVVFDHVGAATFQASLKALARKGRLVACGVTSGADASFPLRPLFMNEQSIIGCKTGSRKEFAQVLELYSAGKVKPVIDSVFPLSEAAKAQARLEGGKHFGKIVLRP